MPSPSPGTAPTPPRPVAVTGRTVAQIARLLDAEPVTQRDATDGDRAPSPLLTGVTHDSRRVRPGDLYAALPGANVHGARFTGDAAAAGAVACLTDPTGRQAALDAGLAVLVVADPRAVLGQVSAEVYGRPGDRMLLLGVTGTNGKTTTTYLLEAALRSAGRTTGLVGTVETRVGDERVPSVRTTPESPDVHGLLAVMAERGVQACAMEVSSHALALHRVDGLVFDVAAFTNLSQDHLDFHGGLEDYFAAKAALFTPQRARRGVVCVDDEWGRRLAAQAQIPITTVGAADADWVISGVVPDPTGATTAFELRSPEGRTHRMTSPLPGLFNVTNTALAFVVLRVAGVDAEAAAQGLAGAGGVPGRMERVERTGSDPLAVVDYAHTPDAVAAALSALRPGTPGRLLVVLGAGGDRDAAKRQAMGEVAARHADVVVVTDDNPRSEDPAAIRAAVLAGARRAAADTGADVREVADRAEAVALAVALAAGPDDTVLVAGKGHEQGQEVAGTLHPFDDRAVLRAALRERARTTGSRS